MTKSEKYAYLESSGWETKSKGLWWKKDNRSLHMNAAVDIQKEADEVRVDQVLPTNPEPEVEEWVADMWVSHGSEDPDFDMTPILGEIQEELMAKVTPPMPESVKQVLEKEPEVNSRYHHVGAGYGAEMLNAINAAKDNVVENYQPKTYKELTEKEEMLHAY